MVLLRLKTFTANEFADLYARQIINFQRLNFLPFLFCAPVPIEHELRKLPKTAPFSPPLVYGAFC